LKTGHIRRHTPESDGRGAMTRLVAALQALGLDGEINLAGRWMKLQGKQCAMYVVEAAWGDGYFASCEDGKSGT
jgi:hypothetical protein